MPIPTKTLRTPASSNVSSLRKTRSQTLQDTSNHDDENRPGVSVASSDVASARAATQSVPRLTAKSASKPVGHTRTTTSVSSIPAGPNGTEKTTASKASTVPSSIARLAGHSRQQNTLAPPKSGLIGKQTRAISTSTTSSDSNTTATARTKPNLTATKVQLSSRKPKSEVPHTVPAKHHDSSEISGLASAPRLREELFQLELVHRPTAATLRRYERSAHESLRREKDRVEQLQNQVRDLEIAHNEAVSSRALGEWMTARRSEPADRQLQLLSHTISKLEDLLVNRAALKPLLTFEQWLAETMAIQEERSASPESFGELRLVKSLGREWSQQVGGLLKICKTHQSTMVDFGELLGQSGIALALNQNRRLIDTLVEEIETALMIEKMITKCEESWEQTELGKILAASEDSRSTDGLQHNPAWM